MHGVREFFVLRDAERTVEAYAPGQHERVRERFRAAERRRTAALGLAEPVPAAVLLRDAITGYLSAIEAASGPAPFARPDAAVALPAVPADPVRPLQGPADDRRVRAALASIDPLYFDALEPQEAERVRRALERTASTLRRRVEPRSLAFLRASRWGRIAAVAVVGLYAALTAARTVFLRKDIALGKPVHPSSLKHNPPDGHALVDGVVGGGFALHTNTEPSPSATIDLDRPYYVDEIDVYNRTDGWLDDCLPLVVELSADGKAYGEIARRTERFGVDPPWIVHADHRLARYVRVRVARRSYLALSEVKVFGEEKAK